MEGALKTGLIFMEEYTPTRFMAEGSHFDKERAEHAINFIQCLKHTKGRFHNEPFILLDWQKIVISTLFGTIKEDGNRQFKTAYIEIPKKNQ